MDKLNMILEKSDRILSQVTKHYQLYSESFDNKRLEFDKQTLLFDTFRSKTNLVKTEEKYPVNNIQEIDFNLDIIVIKTEDLKNILNE